MQSVTAALRRVEPHCVGGAVSFAATGPYPFNKKEGAGTMHSAFGRESGHLLRGAVRRGEAVAIALATLAVLSGCEPEVGSARWCDAMREKPRGDWTANEALDFARHCLFETEE